MGDHVIGAQSAFTGAMSNPVTRYATEILIVAKATFSVLEFEYNAAETEQVGVETLTSFPALLTLRAVKRFQLATGEILVSFGHGK